MEIVVQGFGVAFWVYASAVMLIVAMAIYEGVRRK